MRWRCMLYCIGLVLVLSLGMSLQAQKTPSDDGSDVGARHSRSLTPSANDAIALFSCAQERTDDFSKPSEDILLTGTWSNGDCAGHPRDC